MNKKKILVTAGGTAIAWHICQIIKQYFCDRVDVYVCDINEDYLVPAVSCANKVYKVPYSSDDKYLSSISNIVENEKIDIIIPLLPEESIIFSSDSDFINELNIATTAPSLITSETLSDKRKMFHFLKSISIPTPRIIEFDNVVNNENYILKPNMGFGSLGIKILKGEEIKNHYGTSISDNYIIQEYCHDDDYDEVTVEVYNDKNDLRIFSRKRVATKSGVCVKAVPANNDLFYPYVQKLVDSIECPIAFNLQFLYNHKQWKLFDCNLRLGAGTALSTAVGFQLTRALIAKLLGDQVDDSYFNVDNTIKSVLRVYQEITIK